MVAARTHIKGSFERLTKNYSVSKEYSFSAAHRLHHLPKEHKCRNLHGHNYVLAIEVTSEVLDPDTSMVIDYTLLDQVVEPLLQAVDHCVFLAADDPLLGVLEKLVPETSIVVIFDGPSTVEILLEAFSDIIRDQLVKYNVEAGSEISMSLSETDKTCAKISFSL